METAINTHVVECGEKNRHIERWQNQTEAIVQTLASDVASLKFSKAQAMGYVSGATAIGSIAGAILGAVLLAILQKYLGV